MNVRFAAWDAESCVNFSKLCVYREVRDVKSEKVECAKR